MPADSGHRPQWGRQTSPAFENGHTRFVNRLGSPVGMTVAYALRVGILVSRGRLGLIPLLMAAACQGTIGSPAEDADPSPGSNPGSNPGAGPGTPPGASCTVPVIGRAPLRRLSHNEYRNSLNDLFGNPSLTEVATAGFLAETESLGFRNNADFLQVLPVVAQRYMDAAEVVAETVAPTVTDCTDAACLQTWMQTLGQRIYRRPLNEAEVAAYGQLINAGIAESGPTEAARWVVFTMLQSPSFLYRVELGVPGATGYAAVTGYEMASRLSYLLWQSMPDDALMAAAAAGDLDTPQGVMTAAQRMLADPKARRTYRFFEEWLDLDELPFIERDTDIFGPLGSLPAAFAQETEAFINHVVWDTEGSSFAELMSAPYTFANANLAEHYGLSGPVGEAFERVDLDPSQRAGIFTQGGVLAVHDRPSRTSIVLRGLKMRTDVMCQTVGAPPDDVELSFPEITADLSQRDRLAQHRVDPNCAGCHNLIDPLGIPFENFDAVGRWRDQDALGHTIDPSSALNFSDVDGPVANAAAMAGRLAESQLVRSCFTTQMFRFAYGRRETPEDVCSQQQLETAFASSGHSIRALLLALTQTDAFLYRPVAE